MEKYKSYTFTSNATLDHKRKINMFCGLVCPKFPILKDINSFKIPYKRNDIIEALKHYIEQGIIEEL
jgi:hypothetical protein